MNNVLCELLQGNSGGQELLQASGHQSVLLLSGLSEWPHDLHPHDHPWNERGCGNHRGTGQWREVRSADLEKLVLEFENYQNKLSELIFEIQQKSEQTKQTNKQIAKIEAEKRLNILIENIKDIKKLLNNNTPSEILKQHFTILNNDYKEIEKTLGTDISDVIMQKLGKVREELSNLDLSIKMAELQTTNEKTDEKVLEYKPEFEDDGKPKN